MTEQTSVTETLPETTANTNEGVVQTQPDPTGSLPEQVKTEPAKPSTMLDEAIQKATPEADSKQKEEKPAIPETYELQDHEGNALQLPPEFHEVAKSLGLTQEAAQTVAAKLAPALHDAYVAKLHEQQAALIEQWKADTAADKEFGGEALGANMSKAALAITKTKEGAKLHKLLQATGFGNHPQVLRFLAEVGGLMSPDTKVVTGSPAPTTTKSLVERLADTYRKS